MHHFRYIGQNLHCESVDLAEVARLYGTPTYVYSAATMADNYTRLARSLGGLEFQICFANKANANLAVLRHFANLGAAFDFASGGELRRVLAAGADVKRSVFAGVGKTESEIILALRNGIHAFHVESEPELARINHVAGKLGLRAPVAIRVNPDVDALTHAKISTGKSEHKFGIPLKLAGAAYEAASKYPHVALRGVQMHIGSQITEAAPFEQAVRKVLPLVKRLKEKYALEFFSIGGGLGIVYDPALASGLPEWWARPDAKHILTPAIYAASLIPLLQPLELKILIEPGRFIVGNAGILVTRVEYVKRTGRKTFVIVDGAMNDLMRPALYDSYHEIVPVKERGGRLISCDVVGPVCESADYFCKDRALPGLAEGDLLAVLSAGAYGFVMASNYNGRALAAEVLVDGARSAVVRRRQRVEELWVAEKIPAWLR